MIEKHKKPAVLILSALALLCLFIRYPLMNQSVVLQIGTDGQPTKYIEKPLFCVCFILAVTAFNLYLFLFRRKEKELSWASVLVYAGLCAVVIAVAAF